jgi:UDP-2-acetamido-2,6-beta-L-arabino-hexul-4-ose reductase
MQPLHKNESGSFQELAHASDVKFGQLSILTIAPSCDRGNHYHKRKKEWFCCVHGKCQLSTINNKTGTTRTLLLDGLNREFVVVEPYHTHIVSNPSSTQECELLIINSEEYREEDSDTFKYER